MPPVSVLIKPASGRCNLRCKYCFYYSLTEHRETADFGVMQHETLEVLTKKVLAFAEGYATFSFQGGEPTLCGVDFFRDVIKLQERYNVNGVRIRNCLQTNGILIDEEWARFLHEHHFLVGLSLDGFEELNDRNRIDAAGNGSYERIRRANKLFDQYGVEYNILLVVTKASCENADKLYRFYKKNHFDYLQFIPCIDPLGKPRGESDFSLTPAMYGHFLRSFFQNWKKDFLSGREVSVRYFDNLARIMMGMEPETCSMRGRCQCQFVFEADGSVYPCDFYVTEQWRMGNIRDMDLMELWRTPASQEFMRSSYKDKERCTKCPVYRLCRGGCRRDRMDNVSGDLGLNCYCDAYQPFLQWAVPGLREIAVYVREHADR